jgi:5-methylcytosine-specific restriction enzyme A
VNTDRKQYAHLYDRTWRTLRDAFLRTHPLCRYCHELGLLTPARVVDHRIPHRGDRVLFYDQSNWDPLCTPCHNGPKQQLERTGHRPGTRPDGTPVDPLHPWNRESAPESCSP